MCESIERDTTSRMRDTEILGNDFTAQRSSPLWDEENDIGFTKRDEW